MFFSPDHSIQAELAAAAWQAPGEHPLAKPWAGSRLDRAADPAHILQQLKAAGFCSPATGGHAGKSGIEEFRRSRAHARLVETTAAAGRILDGDEFAQVLKEAPNAEAGGEHVVFHNESDNRFYKLTKPGQYGMQAEDAEAYLERWAIANHPLGFGDHVAFEGMVLLPGEEDYRAVISQPFYQAADPDAPNATISDIEAFLSARGFFFFDLYWVHPLLGLQIWDFNTPGNSNAILTAEGVSPYDLQIEPATRERLRALREKVQQGNRAPILG